MKSSKLALALLAGAWLYPQVPPEPTTTYGMLNGVGWHTQNPGERLLYAKGLQDGILTAYGRAVGTPCENAAHGTAENYVPERSPLTVGQTVDAIGAFYQDPANRLVAVVDAMEISAARQRGVPETVIAGRIQLHRQMAEKAAARR